jgi:hypothetical protein
MRSKLLRAEDPAGERKIVAEPSDGRTAACVAVAWLVLINKPLYPLTIWALIGAEAATRSLAALAIAPLYAGVLWLAPRSGYGARVALPLVGLADTMIAAKAFGSGSGAELYLIACGALAVVGFSAREATTSRAIVVTVYAAFILLQIELGAPVEVWPPADLSRFFALNAYSAASLAAFVGLRFATAE